MWRLRKRRSLWAPFSVVFRLAVDELTLSRALQDAMYPLPAITTPGTEVMPQGEDAA